MTKVMEFFFALMMSEFEKHTISRPGKIPTEVLVSAGIGDGIRRVTVFFPGDYISFVPSGNTPRGCTCDHFRGNIGQGEEWICSFVKYHISTSEHLIIVKPSRIIDRYSIYSNFFQADSTGTPVWAEMHEWLESRTSSDNLRAIVESIHPGQRLRLIGFSRGCSVIFAFLKERDPVLFKDIDSIILVDPGCHELGATFPFDDKDYSRLPDTLKIQLFSSPYQYSDPSRLWLRCEINEFVDKSMCEFRYFSGVENSFMGHISMLSLCLDLRDG